MQRYTLSPSHLHTFTASNPQTLKPSHAALLLCTSSCPLAHSQVVLPDAKVSERDVVVWLEAGQAATEADEAEQRGAVAALHTLASGRNMQVGAAA
jgi:hypothetical protein